MSQFSPHSLKHQFDSDGLTFIPSFRSQLEVGDIQNNLDRVIQNVVPTMPAEHVFYEDKQDRSSLKQLQNLHLHDDYFGQLMTDSPFRKLAETLLDSKVVCKNMQYFNKPPKSGLPTPPHQDGYYFKISPCEAITMWLALEPVDHENGCVRYIPKSHLKSMRPHGSTGTLGFSQGITDFPNADDTAKEIAYPAQPGDLLAHHALTIHRATANHSPNRTRKAIGLIYYREDAREDSKARATYKSKLLAEMNAKQRI